MALHIEHNDPRYAESAAEILRRHNRGEPEANITSAVRDFLVTTGLVKGEGDSRGEPTGPRLTAGRGRGGRGTVGWGGRTTLLTGLGL